MKADKVQGKLRARFVCGCGKIVAHIDDRPTGLHLVWDRRDVTIIVADDGALRPGRKFETTTFADPLPASDEIRDGEGTRGRDDAYRVTCRCSARLVVQPNRPDVRAQLHGLSIAQIHLQPTEPR